MSGGVILVGPVLPYRGGIAHYNTALFRALRAADSGLAGYSFSRQYPKWLYPGKSDLDPTHPDHREPGIDYAIDSMNPWTWWTAARDIAAKRPDMVVFHWWTVFWLPCFKTMAWWLKRRGIRCVLICHNLVDHDAGRLKSVASKAMFASADAYLVHSSEHAHSLATLCPGKPVAQHPLPVYDHYPTAKGLLPKRGRLELLFFGFIRPYKGLDLLVDALAMLNDEQVFLSVVGEPWGDATEWSRLATRAPNIELHLTYTSDEQAAEFFARADLVVLPYRAATGSAVASLAIGYEKPILATQVGGLPDVVLPGVNGFLVPPNDATAIAATLAGITRAKLEAMAQGVRTMKERMSWRSLASTLRGLSDPGAKDG